MPTSTTTVKKQTEIKLDLSGVSGNGSGHNGGGGPNGGGNDGGDDDKRFSPSLYRIGMWVAIASIFMLFMALTGTYIMLVAGSSVWQTLKMPKLLWFSTALIIASSLTFELARQSLNDYKVLLYQKLLYITLALGLGFISIQIVVWQKLGEQGIYAATNQHRFFFYLLTGVHVLHLLGGVIALMYLVVRSWSILGIKFEVAKQQAITGAAALYWHFMDILWVYIFLLLFFWK